MKRGYIVINQNRMAELFPLGASTQCAEEEVIIGGEVCGLIYVYSTLKDAMIAALMEYKDEIRLFECEYEEHKDVLQFKSRDLLRRAKVIREVQPLEEQLGDVYRKLRPVVRWSREAIVGIYGHTRKNEVEKHFDDFLHTFSAGEARVRSLSRTKYSFYTCDELYEEKYKETAHTPVLSMCIPSVSCGDPEFHDAIASMTSTITHWIQTDLPRNIAGRLYQSVSGTIECALRLAASDAFRGLKEEENRGIMVLKCISCGGLPIAISDGPHVHVLLVGPPAGKEENKGEE